MFTEKERAYLDSQRLARLATVEPSGQPDIDAVGFAFDGAHFVVGGHNLAGSRKYKNVAGGQTLVGLIVDDLASTDPWTPRGIKLHARAAAERRDGQFGPGDYLVLTPLVSWSWGIEGDPFVGGAFRPHKTVWTQAGGDDGEA